MVGGVLGLISVQLIQATPGHLTYVVDDSHIHLRLAQMISHGTYGVNSGQPASPASSPLWPFFLALFGRFRWVDWVPLITNLGVALGTSLLAYRVLWAGWSSVHRSALTAWLAAGAASVLMLATGTLALVFEGMEHSIQVFFTVAMVLGVIQLAKDRRAPGVWWLWVAIAVLPLVRYEGALTAAVGVAIASALGAWRPALRSAAVAVLGLGAFSVFLLVLGLPPIPSSVLAKGKPAGVSIIQYVVDNVSHAFRATGDARTPILCVVLAAGLSTVLLAVLGRRALHEPAALLMWGATAIALAQIAFAQPQRRYVGYVVTLTMLVVVGLVLPLLWQSAAAVVAASATAAVAAVVLFGAANYLGVLRAAPIKAQGIYDQQYQMHRLVTDYLREPVAVNDLGHVAFADPYPVVDLIGLGDNEARQLRANGEKDWPAEVMRNRRVSIAMVYPSWFGDDLPRDWILVGRLLNTDFKGGPAENTVALYATNGAAASRLRTAILKFNPTSPDRTVVELVQP